MNTAKFVKDVSENFSGKANVFKLDPPVKYDIPYFDDQQPAKYTAFVVVSATHVPLMGDETFIFPSDELGNVLDWEELDGSYEGDRNIARAIENAGYTIIN
jgi:hypothetical protein